MMLWLAMALAVAPGMPAGVPPAERAVLVELFRATGGRTWRKHEGWLGEPGTECSWHGVECLPDSQGSVGSVWGLSLEDNNLTGTIPASLASLDHLHSLQIWGNEKLAPLPGALLRRWDAGLLDPTGGRASDLREIRMRYATVVLCVDFGVTLDRNGKITYWKQECRPAKEGERPDTFCVIKEGRAWGFERIARLATMAEAEEVPEPRNMFTVIDAPVTYISLVHDDRTVEITNGFRPTPIRRWTLEQAVAGELAFAEWKDVHEERSCPSQ